MKKHRPAGFLPVSQRELALYLGVSPTLMNMAESGRHGDRQLNYAAALKMAELIQAHQQSQHSPAPSASHKKLQDRTATECANACRNHVTGCSQSR